MLLLVAKVTAVGRADQICFLYLVAKLEPKRRA